jgi:alpha-ribazole phosphatase
MEIYLIRHTKPAIEKGICYGISDLDVAASFEVEALNVKNKLPEIGQKAKIFSSPLQRCSKLAQYIAQNHPVEIDQRLIEISFGDWELKPWKSIGMETLMTWKKGFVHTPSPNGEAFQSVFDRVKLVYQAVLELDAEQVFLVCHSGVIRAFLCHLQGTPLFNAFDDQFGFGVVFKIENNEVVKIED